MSTFPAPRAARPTPYRAILLATMIVGAALVAALWVSSAWVPFLAHVAIGVAVVAAAIALRVACAEFAAYRRRTVAEQSQLLSDHREQIHTVHARQREVLTSIERRTRSLRAKYDQTRAELGEAQRDASRLRGDNEALRLANSGLRERLAAVPAETDADVLALPVRRVDADLDAMEAPTVIDLDLQRLASPFVEDVLRRHAN